MGPWLGYIQVKKYGKPEFDYELNILMASKVELLGSDEWW
jgi:hypothetical protein